MNTKSRGAITAAIVASLAVANTACDRPGTPQRANARTVADSAKPVLSPVETARQISKLHNERKYVEMAKYLNDGVATETVAFLRAVDRVIDAHERLQSAANDRFGSRVYHAWNIASLENNLGIFSRDVRVLGQTFQGDSAIVTLQAGETVPLVRAEFTRDGGEWRLKTGMQGEPLIPSLESLATRIDDVTVRLRNGLTPFEYYDAVAQELMPQLISIAQADAPLTTRVTDATRDD
jgi:hypothetical protein